MQQLQKRDKTPEALTLWWGQDAIPAYPSRTSNLETKSYLG